MRTKKEGKQKSNILFKILVVAVFIGITAVSDGCRSEEDILRLENAIKKLKDVGFNSKETKNVRNSEKFASSEAKERANEFMQLLDDKDVKAIIAVSGGEILMEMLPFLDFEKIKRCQPKWIQGYSDPSLLNYVITTFIYTEEAIYILFIYIASTDFLITYL